MKTRLRLKAPAAEENSMHCIETTNARRRQLNGDHGDNWQRISRSSDQVGDSYGWLDEVLRQGILVLRM